MSSSRLSLSSALGMMLCICAALSAQEHHPDLTIIDVLEALVEEVESRRDELERDVCLRYELVDRRIEPHFDLLASSHMILGREIWQGETEATQDRFLTAFYRWLLASYGDLVVHFEADTLVVQRLEEVPTNRVHTLRNAVLTRNDRSKERVDLVMFHRQMKWRIVDIIYGGVSLAEDYEAEFLSQIREIGFGGLIDRLVREAAPRLEECGL